MVSSVEFASKPAHPPAPKADLDSAFYWDGLRQHKLLLQCCADCRRFRFPPMPACPFCASPRSNLSKAGGRGSIYSWIIVRRAFDAAFRDQVPYTLATIDLEEGARTVARLEGGAEASFGLKVRAEFFDHRDWTELRFRAAG